MLFRKKTPTNRSSYSIEFQTDSKGNITILGNKDTFIALSLQLDLVIEGETKVSRKFRKHSNKDKDIIVTLEHCDYPAI